MINVSDIRRARENINSFIHKTPLIHSSSFSKLLDTDVYIKAENLQKTGSFKVRGAFNKLMDLKNGKVIAASMGNHAQGVAFAAGNLGIQARIIMPLTAPIVKQEATKGYGAEVILHGENFSQAMDYARSQKDYTFIHAFDDEKIIAGQGTIGLEIFEDLDNIDFVIVPVGGGGLISGISIAVNELSSKTKVVGVQTEASTSAYESCRQKNTNEKPPLPTIADGIAVGRLGEMPFRIIEKHVSEMLLVKEETIAMAVLLFLERKKLVVEGAGAVPLAALIENKEKFRGKRIVLVVSGGNIDFTLIDRIIHKGLVSSGRIGVFEVIVDDIPGSLNYTSGVIAAHRGNVLDVVHDRLSRDLPIGKTRVIFTVETKNKGHLEEILSDFRAKGLTAKTI